jgi:hypothetical protein
MGYDGQGIGKRRQGILIPIVVEQRVKHEGLGLMVEGKGHEIQDHICEGKGHE